MKLNDFHHMTAPKANPGWANFAMDKLWPGHYGSRMRRSDHVGPYIRGKQDFGQHDQELDILAWNFQETQALVLQN